MAQALSAEEFQRMQEQLLQLRSENYRLSDELRKNGAELSALRQRVQALDRDLAKANKALSKSKKAQEVEALLGETRMLQGKLQSQEDDFRLQNSTLLRELAKLCAQIEGLEQENRRLQEGGAPGPPPDPPQDGATGDNGAPLAHTDAPLNPPKEPPPAEEGTGTDAPPPAPQAEVAQLQAEVAELMEKLRKQENSSLQMEVEKETLLRDQQLELEKLRAQRDEEFRELQTRIQQLQQELEAAAKACVEEREGLRQRLSEAEAAWEESERRRQQTQEQLEQREQEQAAAKQHRVELEGRVGELQVALGNAERQRELQEAEGQALRQELKDVQDGQRILEKKGSAALKDLKRQLQLERRRADRLQERLQELLAPTRTRSGLEELGLEGGSPGRGPGGDSSSLSSLGRDGSAPGSTKSGSGSPGGGSGGGGVPSGGGLSPAEVAELFQRLAQSQQERWLLEEKVRHLEVSSASMAEDLCRKSAIIQSFVRDSRLEAAGPAGPARRGAGPGEEGLREMNKKLQNMLEEQLTKNLHLGQDLEALSQELARLSKERAAPPGPP
ncbi:GRIP1-associated protein 1 isoform X3 [Pezoporus flaviventris]|uniref:GRIP1-associated protein 1 isoform X3 n=1 Tax=Pezoporus flaviventris TaxID=889875 RepID=UPI002AB21C83|nr:GRIP1-associated protein 1 isoform X3 [Pezoporus flaviventris]